MDYQLIEAAFPEDWQNIKVLLAEDQRFAEAVGDFLEISRVLQELLKKRDLGSPEVEDARITQSELKLELAERMERAGYHSSKKLSSGDIT